MFYHSFKVLLLLPLLLTCSFYSYAQSGTTLHGNSHFKIQNLEDHWKVDVMKEPWESLSLAIEEVQDSVSLPKLSLDLKTDQTIRLRLEFIHPELGIEKKKVFVVRKRRKYSNLTIDLSDVISSSKEAVGGFIKLTINPGKSHSGRIKISKQLKWKGTAIQESKPSVNVYPNPAANFINISFTDKKYKVLWIYSRQTRRRVRMRVAPNRNEMSVNVQHLPRGLYYLKLVGEGTPDTRQVILN